MGLIRKTLHVASGGAVASRSKKQRTAAQTPATLQGKNDAEVRIAGGRGFEYENRAKQNRRRSRPNGPKPTFTPEELEYMRQHAVSPYRQQ